MSPASVTAADVTLATTASTPYLPRRRHAGTRPVAQTGPALRIVPAVTRVPLPMESGIGPRGLIDELHMPPASASTPRASRSRPRPQPCCPYHRGRRRDGARPRSARHRAGSTDSRTRRPRIRRVRRRRRTARRRTRRRRPSRRLLDLAKGTSSTVVFLTARLEGASALVEGAQGTMLDAGLAPSVRHQFATSASASASASAHARRHVIGVAKVPLQPSRIGRQLADRLRRSRRATARRCGYRRVAGRHAAREAHRDHQTRRPSGFECRIGIVTDYEARRRRDDAARADDAGRVARRGRDDDTTGAHRIRDLPPRARNYLAAIETALTVPIEAVSVGPERRCGSRRQDRAAPRRRCRELNANLI